MIVFLTPFYLQRVIHLSPDQIGLLMTCSPLAVMAVAPLSGSLSDRLGTRELAVAGSSLCTAALVAMAFLPVSASALAVGWRLAFFGFGSGIFQSPNNSAVMGSVPRPYLGIASGILATARNAGMALGIAVAGLILYSLVPPSIVAQEQLSGAEALLFLGGLRSAYLFAAGLSALAALFSFWRGAKHAPGHPSQQPRRTGVKALLLLFQHSKPLSFKAMHGVFCPDFPILPQLSIKRYLCGILSFCCINAWSKVY